MTKHKWIGLTVALVAIALVAYAGTPVTESPTGQWNVDVLAGRNQNAEATPAPNYLKLTGNNAAGIAVPTPAAGECVFGDTTATSATDEFSLMCSNGLTVGTSLLVPAINGSTVANGDITIQGTTDATRTTSYVNLQPNGGNVGIGTASPNATLQLVSPGVTANTPTTSDVIFNGHNQYIASYTSDDSGYAGFLVKNVSTGKPFIQLANNMPSYYTMILDDTNVLNIREGAAGGTARLTINSGNVGIGTAAPTEKLTIKSGHLSFMQTTAPTVTAGGCVTNTVTTKSTDTVGEVTLAGTCTTVTSVTITFNIAHTSRPICNAFFTSVNAGGLTVKTTDASAVNTMVITTSGAVTTGDKIGWHCLDMDTAA